LEDDNPWKARLEVPKSRWASTAELRALEGEARQEEEGVLESPEG
jgi:hypothetical protein